MAFKPGDRVQHLLSAIPKIVEKVEGDQITCSWPDPKGNIKRDTFPASSLKPAKGRRPIRYGSKIPGGDSRGLAGSEAPQTPIVGSSHRTDRAGIPGGERCLTEISHGVTELTRIWFSGEASAPCIRRSSRAVFEIAQMKICVSSRRFSGPIPRMPAGNSPAEGLRNEDRP